MRLEAEASTPAIDPAEIEQLEKRYKDCERVFEQENAKAFRIFHHNFGNLAAVVGGNLQLARNQTVGAQDNLELARKWIGHLERLTEALAQKRPRATEIGKVVHGIRSDLADRLRLQPEQVQITTNGIGKHIARIYEPALFEAIAELAYNAAKAHNKAGKENEPIRVDFSVGRSKRTGRKQLTVRVTDVGPGVMREKMLDYLSSTSSRIHGLRGVQQIAQLHRGRLGFESRAGQGSSFWIRMPLRPR